jgi:hypothetical protein
MLRVQRDVQGAASSVQCDVQSVNRGVVSCE